MEGNIVIMQKETFSVSRLDVFTRWSKFCNLIHFAVFNLFRYADKNDIPLCESDIWMALTGYVLSDMYIIVLQVDEHKQARVVRSVTRLNIVVRMNPLL